MTFGRKKLQAKVRAAVAAGVVLGMPFAPMHGAYAADDGARGGLFDSVLETMDLKTKAGSVPDFVEATKPDPAKLRFIPTGELHPKRPTPAKSSDAIEAAKAALDAARDAQLAPKPAPVSKPVKGGKPVPAAKTARKVPPSDEATAGN